MALTVAAHAQLNTPQPSPLSTVSQKVGLTDVTITYSRPSAKGRPVFGDLVPYDVMWRTGANRSTKLTVSDTVKINGVKIPKGDYSIFTVPGKMEWMVIISKQVDLGGTNGYKDSEDVTRFKVKPEAIGHTETFTMNFSDVTSKSANIEIAWEKTRIKIPIESDPDAQVMKSIDAALTPNAGTYFQAARYYFETGKDLKKALEWITLSVQKEERFWVLRQKSLIEAQLGDYKAAIATAQRSLELATKDNNQDYIKMNNESIAEWKKKL